MRVRLKPASLHLIEIILAGRASVFIKRSRNKDSLLICDGIFVVLRGKGCACAVVPGTIVDIGLFGTSLSIEETERSETEMADVSAFSRS